MKQSGHADLADLADCADMHPRNGRLLHGELTESIIGAFYLVYNELGYGFLEKVYVEALVRVLRKLGHQVQREVQVPIYFQGEVICLQRLDLLVEEKVVLEVKSTHSVSDADHRQLFSYLNGTRLEVGLLLHFGPKPEFYRTVCTTHRGRPLPSPPAAEESNPPDQPNPPNP